MGNAVMYSYALCSAFSCFIKSPCEYVQVTVDTELYLNVPNQIKLLSIQKSKRLELKPLVLTDYTCHTPYV
jgi:hypothetical protein